MRTRPKVMIQQTVFLIALLLIPCVGHADVEWSVIKELDLKAQPLDVVSSPDGQQLYVLTPGEILIYSLSEEKETARLPVDKGFERLAISPRDNSLILTSSKTNMLKIIQLDFIQKIDVDGLYFRGPKDAAVTIAVFSDYQ